MRSRVRFPSGARSCTRSSMAERTVKRTWLAHSGVKILEGRSGGPSLHWLHARRSELPFVCPIAAEPTRTEMLQGRGVGQSNRRGGFDPRSPTSRSTLSDRRPFSRGQPWRAHTQPSRRSSAAERRSRGRRSRAHVPPTTTPNHCAHQHSTASFSLLHRRMRRSESLFSRAQPPKPYTQRKCRFDSGQRRSMPLSSSGKTPDCSSETSRLLNSGA